MSGCLRDEHLPFTFSRLAEFVELSFAIASANDPFQESIAKTKLEMKKERTLSLLPPRKSAAPTGYIPPL